MYTEHWSYFGPHWGIAGMGWPGGTLFILSLIWSLAWKGFALWRAAREGSRGWYVALLVINTLGVLEILYLYVFSTKKTEPTTVKTPSSQ